MAPVEPAPLKFKPERPIYLHETNTGFKTADEVKFAVEKLRDLGWLAAYNERIRPLHMSFNNEKEFAAFKKCCKDLDIILKAPPMKHEDFDSIEEKIESAANPLPAGADDKDTTEDSNGKIRKNK